MTAPKLSDLTEQDKIRLAAELDFTCICPHDCTDECCPICVAGMDKPENWPCYSTSYDAIIPLIQKLNKASAVSGLTWNMGRDYSIEATPSQLLDALLVATGKATI